jgi:hypothetical protein
MFVSQGGAMLREELAFLESRFSPAALIALLREDPFGEPLLLAPRYLTSHNSVRQLYHLTRFEARIGVDALNARTIVEWGGGYGTLAKIAARSSTERTYVLIDTPMFLALQWLYLAVVLGEDRVAIRRWASDPLVHGKLNLVPLGRVEDLSVEADLFVSLRSLEESSAEAQTRVAERGWFGAKHLLVSFRIGNPRLPDSALTGRLAAERGAVIEPIGLRPNHSFFYALR